MIEIIKKDKSKSMVFGFYPKGGNIFGAALNSKDGQIWLPDPHYVPDHADPTYRPKPVTYYGSDIPIEYVLTEEQADIINNILSNTNCVLKDGNTSRGIKRDRIECPDSIKYCMIGVGSKSENCVTWTKSLFSKFEEDIGSPYMSI